MLFLVNSEVKYMLWNVELIENERQFGETTKPLIIHILSILVNKFRWCKN